VVVALALGAGWLGTTAASEAATPRGAAASSGTLRMAAGLSQTAAGPVTFDPTEALTQATNISWELPVYDTLLHRNPKTGAFTPGLATKATVTDASTITIALRRGVTFTDGTPFDAAAVRSGILRNRDAPQHGQFDGTLKSVAAIDVTDDHDLVIHLSSPVAGAFYDQLSLPATYIASPTAVQKGASMATSPVGAGPFKLENYTPNQSITLVKNRDYWDAKHIAIGEIDFVDATQSPQVVNGLKGGSFDLANLSDLGSISALKGSGFDVVEVTTSHAPLWSDICKSTDPFGNVEVRQALNYAIDRDAIKKSVLHGLGDAGSSLWPKGTPYYDAKLANTFAYNRKKAKKLLADAGFPNGFTAEMIVFPGSALVSQVDQVLQQQWAAIGVKLTLSQSQNAVTDYYVRHSAPMSVVTGSGAGLFGPLSGYVPGTIADICSYSDPALNAIYAQAQATDPASPQGVALLRQMQQSIVQQGLGIFISNLPSVWAASSKISGLVMNPSYGIVPVPDYWSGVSVRP
jgi:ABC-type transport system substrate-binding protein